MTLRTQTFPARTAGPERTCLVCPAQPEQAVKSWRKLVTGVDDGARGAFALQGKFLSPSVAYDLPVGAVVVVVDQYPDRWEVAMTRTGTGELEPVREPWVLKGALGKRCTDYIARRLPAGAAGHQAVRLDDHPNSFPGQCMLCRNPLEAGQGRLMAAQDGRTRPAHRAGECLPPPPLPEVLTPNRRPESCLLCGRWVAAGDGIARLTTATAQGRPVYRAAHDGPCPADALPGPVNNWAGWCARCTAYVEAGTGYWDVDDREVHHRPGACPDPEGEPVWWVRRPRGEESLEPGQVRRVQVDLRDLTLTGRRQDVPVNSPVPASAAGFRVLSPQYMELVARVLECVPGRRGRQWARVRAATPAEAVTVMAQEAADELETRPAASLLRGSFSVMQIGRAPWLAEIVGRDPDHGLDRRFLHAHTDYTNSNRKGTRGAVFHWVLRPNALYETEYSLSHHRRQREFLKVNAEGDVQEITQEEVTAWLNTSATWPAL
ncbi:hypothetical protein [Streptomyces sp. NPDC053720]|uniref:hypothetical protein n=1 Tax=Streptomyces sp. NPDC053720 TaxID=3154855 RepID=UPI0034249E21